METAVEKRVWTEEELMRVQHDGNKCELIDGELVRLYKKIEHALALRKKKEHDLQVLKESFGEPENDIEIKLSLANILKEKLPTENK